MKRLSLFLLFSLFAFSQEVRHQATDPSGSCNADSVINVNTGVLWTCKGHAYTAHAPISTAAVTGSAGWTRSGTTTSTTDAMSIGNTLVDPVTGLTAPMLACAGTPGSTVGPFRSICATTAGIVYVCKNAAGCAVAGDWQSQAGATGAAGSDGQVQYNTGGALAGDAGLAYNSGTFALGVKGAVSSGQAGVGTGVLSLIGTTSGSVSLTTTATGTALVVNKPLSLATIAAYTCDSTTRGQFNYIAGGAGVKDIVQVCGKDVSDVYAWRAIY